MGKKEKAPCLRFKDTNGKDYPAWEQRKLSNLSTLRGGFAFKSDNYQSSGVPIIRISNLLSNGTIGAEFKYYPEQNNDAAFTLRNGAVVLAMSGATTGKVSTLHCEDSKKYYQNQRVGYFLPSDSCNYDFLSVLLCSHYFSDQLAQVLVAGAQPNVSPKDINSFVFKVPVSLIEQKKIGGIFSCLDEIITLHQRKLETLKKLKRTLLQKMFPKKGHLKPELRFFGFTNDWEQRKFGDLFTEYAEKGFKQYPALSIVQGAGTIERDKSNRNLSYSTNNLGNYKIVYKDDFILHLRSFEGGLERASSTGLVSPAYHVFHSEEVNSSFFYCVFRSSNFINRLLKPCVYGIRDGKSINVSELKNVYLNIPAISEQKKIGDFFDSVDSLITLYQRKLEIYKKLKKGLLQKMFI